MKTAPTPRVAVTRDEDLDGALSVALRNAGLEPALCPVVEIVPPRDLEPLACAARALATYDWLVVSSPRAVAAIAEASGGIGLPETLWTATVGESTAAALRAAGARSVLVGRGGGARGLIPLLVNADAWIGRRVLIPRAEQGGRRIAAALRARGARVDEVVAYRTLPRPAEEIARGWQRARPDAVVVTSPSAARALVRALGSAALRALDAVVAIGPTTAAQLVRLGIAADLSESADFTSIAICTRRALDPGARASGREDAPDPEPGCRGLVSPRTDRERRRSTHEKEI